MNWFRTGSDGKFLWPGFGDNLRVIEWILARVEGSAEANETPIGYVPKANSLDLTGLDLDQAVMDDLLSIDPKEWLVDLKSQDEFFGKFGDRLPKEIEAERKSLRERLSK